MIMIQLIIQVEPEPLRQQLATDLARPADSDHDDAQAKLEDNDLWKPEIALAGQSHCPSSAQQSWVSGLESRDPM